MHSEGNRQRAEDNIVFRFYIDPARMGGNKSIRDNLLYSSGIQLRTV